MNAEQHRIQKEKDAESLVTALVDIDPAAFVRAFRNEHRTDQQSAFLRIAALLHALSDDYVDGYFDLRNEATVTASHEAWRSIKNIPIPFI